MTSMLVNLNDRPDLSKATGPSGRSVPGVGDGVPVLKDATGAVRFLGDEETGPWVYHLTRPAGDRVPMHKHHSNRVEFLIEGEIEWVEPGKDPVIYGAGTMSYVEAGTPYGYNVLQDARILLVFEAAPGVRFL